VTAKILGVLETMGLVLDFALRSILVVLLAGMALLVIAAVVFRYGGSSLRYYDEVAAIMLAWITYYGAALAALRGQHMATTGLVNAMPRKVRIIVCLFSRALIIGFLLLLAVMGFRVLEAISGMNLISLPSVPRALAQHVIPVGACLYILAEVIRLPQSLREASEGRLPATEG